MTGSVWIDILLFAVFIGILSVGMFRLDTLIATSRPKAKRPRKGLCGIDDSGKIVVLDPDGRRPRRKMRG
jgi:hypothetical protein